MNPRMACSMKNNQRGGFFTVGFNATGIVRERLYPRRLPLARPEPGGHSSAFLCRSPLAYRDVGKGREQDAEALPAKRCWSNRPQAGSYINLVKAAYF
jgi:hypothetical protein